MATGDSNLLDYNAWKDVYGSTGTLDDYKKYNPNDVMPGSNNPLLEVNNQAGLFGLTNGYWNNMGQAAGLAGTAYGLYDSMFGNTAEKNKLQMQGLRQNIDFAKKANDSHYAFTDKIGKGFEGAFSGGNTGLAASLAKPKTGV